MIFRQLRFQLLLIVFVVFELSCSTENINSRSKIRISVGHATAEVEVAATPETRERGLMYRAKLDDNQGMLFVFAEEHTLVFWMKNTLIPLDIGFFDAQGLLLSVERMKPDNGATTYRSPSAALYALEMNQGWFDKNNILKYAQLKLPYEIIGE
ncbi:MAG: DUF192 domain-containing protein [Leptonema sp. (in: Bacteria)]|nr:DUF192 domain-containing protein [Leptonema sp. (in: bacteria)]